ncbi:MAG: hypothetical protein CMN37_08260 [SAR116 cluster bacterium]|nr:hypothetical protein [SAR116 cluster bacterium]
MENKTKRGRPKKDSVMETIAVRLPYDTILEIDNYVNQVKKKFHGMNVTRADAIRQLINNGLNLKADENDTSDIEEEKRRFWD